MLQPAKNTGDRLAAPGAQVVVRGPRELERRPQRPPTSAPATDRSIATLAHEVRAGVASAQQGLFPQWARLYLALSAALVRARARAQAETAPTLVGQVTSATITGVGVACLLPLAVAAMALNMGSIATGAMRGASAVSRRLVGTWWTHEVAPAGAESAPPARRPAEVVSRRRASRLVAGPRPPSSLAHEVKPWPESDDDLLARILDPDFAAPSDVDPATEFFLNDAGGIDGHAHAPHLNGKRVHDTARVVGPTMYPRKPFVPPVLTTPKLLSQPDATAAPLTSSSSAAANVSGPLTLSPTRGRSMGRPRSGPIAPTARPRAGHASVSPPRHTPSLSPPSSTSSPSPSPSRLSSDDDECDEILPAVRFALNSTGSRLSHLHWLSDDARESFKRTADLGAARFIVQDATSAALLLNCALSEQATAQPRAVGGAAATSWDRHFLEGTDAVEFYCGPRRSKVGEKLAEPASPSAVARYPMLPKGGGLQRTTNVSRRYVGQVSVQRKIREAFPSACPQLRTALVRATGGDVAWSRQLFALSEGRSLEALAHTLDASCGLSLQRGGHSAALPHPTSAARHYTHLSWGTADEVVLEAGTLFADEAEGGAATFVAVKVRLGQPHQARPRLTLTDVWLGSSRPW